MDDKELPECVELNVHTKHNELGIESKTPTQLKTQSFPQSDSVQIKMNILMRNFILWKKRRKMNISTIHSLLCIQMKMSTRQILLFLMKNISKVNFMTHNVMKIQTRN